MADNETIADIIAEKRQQADKIERDCAEKMKRGEMVSDCYARELVADIRREANRLEAAHKRERGNAAKLREALVRILDWLKRMNAQPLNTLAVSELTPSYAVNRTAKSIIEDNDYHISQLTAALSAPPRNCDVMDWRTAWKMWREKFHPETPVGYSAVVKGTEAFMDWFTAPATEKEGGAE